MALTTKELALLSDNIKMAQNSIKFIQGCADMCSDPQITALCNEIASERQKDINMLQQHINRMVQ